MRLLRWRGQKLRMIRDVERDGRRSFLVGSLRPFPLPHHFHKSLDRLLEQLDRVLIDPPTTPPSPLPKAGTGDTPAPSPSILDRLDAGAVSILAKTVSPGCDRPATPPFACMVGVAPESHLRGLLRGLPAPWAFLAAWTEFLEARGWTESLDREVLAAARRLGTEILPLRTPDQEARLLESIPEAAVIACLENARNWEIQARHILDGYLDGDLEGTLEALRNTLPSPPAETTRRHASLVVERALPHLEAGRSALFAPLLLLPDMMEDLTARGFKISPR